jgi:hypothetical protein
MISFLSRPISLSVRLFANMLAGHITLKVFAGFVASLSALGALGVGGAVLPLIMTVAMTGSRIPRCLPAGLRLRGTDLHVPERRRAWWSLRSIVAGGLGNGCQKQPQQPISQGVSHGSGSSKVHRRRSRMPRHGWYGPSALGRIFGDYLSGALRNPSAADGQFGRLIFGFAVTEALGIFSLLVALLLLFAV